MVDNLIMVYRTIINHNNTILLRKRIQDWCLQRGKYLSDRSVTKHADTHYLLSDKLHKMLLVHCALQDIQGHNPIQCECR